jgi:beta-xylosidase
VVVVLAVALVLDEQTQMRLHHTQGQIETTQALVARTAALARSTEDATRRARSSAAAVQRRVDEVSAEVHAVSALVDRAGKGVVAGGIEVGVVHNCAGGVQRSVSALAAGNQAQAVADLRLVSSICESLLGAQAGGPVYPFDFADPDVLVTHGGYVAYGTNSTAGNIQIMTSSDLVHWKKQGNALPTLAPWAKPGYTWAPAVIHLRRSYLLYYTAATAQSNVHCLSVATAKRPQGPFVDKSKAPLECQPGAGGSIDPSPYVDATGRPYLAWKSNGGHGQPATLWAQALNRQGTALLGTSATALLSPSQSWEGSVVEAPSMIRTAGGYYLFYSANNWDSARYAIGMARCSGPTGPCQKPLPGPLLGSGPTFAGPGGESVFTDSSGHLQMAFHGWLPGAVGYPHSRVLFVRPLEITNGVAQIG